MKNAVLFALLCLNFITPLYAMKHGKQEDKRVQKPKEEKEKKQLDAPEEEDLAETFSKQNSISGGKQKEEEERGQKSEKKKNTVGGEEKNHRTESSVGKQEEKEEDVTKEAAPVTFPQAHFSPGIEEVLIQFIRNEQKAMKGAWYRFTLYKVAQEITTRIKNKVSVSLIIDESNFGGSKNAYGKIDEGDFCEGLQLIANKGGKIYKKVMSRNPENKGSFEIMHHKFMLFKRNVNNRQLLWTGSFNATGQANLKNCENVVILDDKEVIEKFKKEYKTVLKLCGEPLKVTECTSTKTKNGRRGADLARDMNGIPH